MATAYRSSINDIKTLHDQIYGLQMIIVNLALKLMKEDSSLFKESIYITHDTTISSNHNVSRCAV